MRSGVQIFVLCEEGQALAEVAPELGNNCFAFCTREPILEPVGFDDFLKKPTSYGIPILFPFPNRIKDGKFHFGDKCYTVDPSRHGFVRDKHWNVDSTGASDDQGAWIKSSLEAAQYPKEILDQFPFEFRIEVTYRLKNSTLEMETVVRNTGNEVMPLGFGIHPYFTRPARGSIQIPALKRWELTDYIPTGKILDVMERYDLRRPRDLSTLGDMDDVFTEPSVDPDGFVRCKLNNHDKQVQMVIEVDSADFHEVAVYTPSDRQAICIEPYSCPTDAFNLYARGVENHHIILLEPNGIMSFKVRIYSRSLMIPAETISSSGARAA